MTSVKQWANRIVGHGEEPPDQLLANPENWRIHPKEQQAALGAVLDTVGWVQDVIVNRTTGHVVDGHLRVSLAITREEPSIPVVYVEISEEEERLMLATLDPLAAMAGTDKDILRGLLDQVEVSQGELARLVDSIRPADVREGADVIREVPKPTWAERGMVVKLGRHRLMCGDATDADDVARLLTPSGGSVRAVPALMVTDPPYGVDYDPAWRVEQAEKGNLAYAPSRVGEVTNDDRSDWSDAWKLSPSSVAYVWHDWLQPSATLDGLAAAGFTARMHIVWTKRPVVSRGHYNVAHECCWYAVRGTAGWIGGGGQSSVWDVPLDKNVEGGHSTQKPVECMERPIRNHSGDVYDPFVGSGTTIIAAERTGRACYAMEIDPAYVEMAVARWEAYTEQTHEVEDD